MIWGFAELKRKMDEELTFLTELTLIMSNKMDILLMIIGHLNNLNKRKCVPKILCRSVK